MTQLRPVEFTEHQLDNGLRVILYRSDRVPLVHLTIHYRVGSSYEKPGHSGFAHLFEHMMFQGSAQVGKNEHGRYVDKAGGRWNATTSKDRTNYYETLPSHHLSLALWLEADRMRSLHVTEENFDNQRQTVIEEKKQSYDNRPYGLAYLRFDELAYQNWAYAHSIIGSVDDLQSATLADAAAFHGQYYGPDNATMVIAGNIEETPALQSIREFFDSVPASTDPALPDLREPEQQEEKFEAMTDPLAVLTALYTGYHMPGIGSPDYYALSVLALILSQGESSRLYRKMVYDNNWVSGLSAGPNMYRGPGLFTIWLQIQNEADVKTVRAALLQELAEICDKGVEEGELTKAKNQILFHFTNSRSTVSAIGEALARYTTFFDDPSLINCEVDRFLNVSRADIREAAARTFRPQNSTAILVEPLERTQ